MARSIILLAVVIILTIVIVWSHRKKAPTLYDRLGGPFAIAMVVNHFSDALINNPVVGKNSKNPYLADWHTNKLDRLPGLKFMRTTWLCALAGGPFKYSPTRAGKCPFSLENAHIGLQISPSEFDAVAMELSKSLDACGVKSPEKDEVLAAFASHKNDVTMGYNLAHGFPVQPIAC